MPRERAAQPGSPQAALSSTVISTCPRGEKASLCSQTHQGQGRSSLGSALPARSGQSSQEEQVLLGCAGWWCWPVQAVSSNAARVPKFCAISWAQPLLSLPQPAPTLHAFAEGVVGVMGRAPQLEGTTCHPLLSGTTHPARGGLCPVRSGRQPDGLGRTGSTCPRVSPARCPRFQADTTASRVQGYKLAL